MSLLFFLNFFLFGFFDKNLAIKKFLEIVKFHCDYQINFVKDRPGHDTRYAIDATKIYNNLGWRPQETFETGLKKTVKWYLENTDWWESVLSGEYKLKRQGD